MNYSRPAERKDKNVPFAEGKHRAKILNARLSISKDKGNKMISMKITGKLNELAYVYIVFGNTMTEDNLRFLLASIEDNGVDIPNIDFGYNEQTVRFLIDKYVYIDVIVSKKAGKIRGNVDRFLTKAEFSGIEEDEFPNQDEESNDWEGAF